MARIALTPKESGAPAGLAVKAGLPCPVERLVAEHEPDLVGLSVMTFQRKTAKGIIDLVRTRRPRAHVVVGGYDPSLAPETYPEDPDGGVDFTVRTGPRDTARG